MIDPYGTGVLTREKHERLVMDLERLCSRAGIGGDNNRYVWTPVKGELEAEEISYLQDLKKLVKAEEPKFGFLYKGSGKKQAASIQERMMLMTGCLLRNYVDARLMHVDTIMQYLMNNSTLDAEVLLIPNFFVAKDAESMLDFKKSLLHNLLLARISDGLQTVVYVDRPSSLGALYGDSVKGLLNARNYVHFDL